VEGVEWCIGIEGFVRQMKIHQSDNGQHERREINQKTLRFGPKEAASPLSHVGPKTKQVHRETRDMEEVLDENAFSIEAEDSSATTENRDVRIVSHVDVEARDGLVGDKRRLIRSSTMSVTTLILSQIL
jgi:hypothetical protein